MNKACPIILRETDGGTEILAFSHPIAGNQLVKGTIEQYESLSHACTRELKEESGVDATPPIALGVWDSKFDNQIWGFYLMEPDDHLLESWEYFTKDDGGHLFEFFWQPIQAELDSNWHPVFIEAINFVKEALPSLG